MPFCKVCAEPVFASGCAKCGPGAGAYEPETTATSGNYADPTSTYIPGGAAAMKNNQVTMPEARARHMENRLADAAGISIGGATYATTTTAARPATTSKELLMRDEQTGEIKRLAGTNSNGNNNGSASVAESAPVCSGCMERITSGAAVDLAGRIFHAVCSPSCDACAVSISQFMAGGGGRSFATGRKGGPEGPTVYFCGPCAALKTTAGSRPKEETKVSEGSRAQKGRPAGGDVGGDGSYGASAEPCATCGRPMGAEEGVRLSDSAVIHYGCLVCELCEKAISSGVFKRRGGRPYHPKCHDDTYGPGNTESGTGSNNSNGTSASGMACGKCGRAITGTFSRIDGKPICKPCLVCAKCGGSLSGGFAKIGGALHCADCASKPRVTGRVAVGPRTKGFVIDPITGEKRTVG